MGDRLVDKYYLIFFGMMFGKNNNQFSFLT